MKRGKLSDIVRDAAGEGLGFEDRHRAGVFFGFKAFEYIDIPTSVADKIVAIVSGAAPEGDPEEELNTKNALDDDIEREIRDACVRARAWKAGRSMPGWETTAADEMMILLRRIAEFYGEFLLELPWNLPGGSDALHRLAVTISDAAKADDDMTDPATAARIGRALTMGWGSAHNFKGTYEDMMKLLRRGDELGMARASPRWMKFFSRLDEIFQPLKDRDADVEAIASSFEIDMNGLMPGTFEELALWSAKGGSFANDRPGGRLLDVMHRIATVIFPKEPKVTWAFMDKMSALVDAAMEKIAGIESSPGEGGGDAPYGKFIFARKRKDRVPPEKDTPEEERAYAALSAHINDNDALPQDVALELMGQLDAGAYGKILKEPDATWVYRGMKLPPDKLAKMIGEGTAADFMEAGSLVLDKFIKTRRGSEGSTAWTMNVKMALGYAHDTNDDECRVIFVAKVDDNRGSFLSGPDGLYDVIGLDGYKGEKEAVALGPVKVHKVYWQHARHGGAWLVASIAEKNVKTEGVSLMRSYVRLLLSSR